MSIPTNITESQRLELLLAGVSHSQTAIRLDAIKQLGSWYTPIVLSLLLQIVDDEDPLVRSEAVNALGCLHAVEAKECLTARLFVETSARVRAQIIKALAKIAASDACGTFIAALEDLDTSVRRCAASILRRWSRAADVPQLRAVFRVAQTDILPILHEILLKSEDLHLSTLCLARLATSETSIRVTMIVLLSQHAGDQNVVDCLIPLLQDVNATIRCHAARALGLLANRSALKPLLQALADPEQDVLHNVVLALRVWEEEPQVREALQKLLSQNLRWEISLPAFISLNDEQGIQSMLASLSQNTQSTPVQLHDGYRQLAMLKDAAKKGKAIVIEPLVSLMQSKTHSVFRSQAAGILAYMGTVEAIKRLQMMVLETPGEASHSAFWALLRVEDKQRMTMVLIDIVKRSTDISLCCRAVDALGKSDDERVIQHLVDVAHMHEQAEVRCSALKSLVRWIDRIAIRHALFTGLIDENSSVRMRIIKLLQGVPVEEYFLSLVEDLLYKEQWEIRRLAIQILRDRSGEKVVLLLEKGLKDDVDIVREEAVCALKQDLSAVPLLIRALKDPSWTIATKAANRLALIGDQRAMEPLIQALRSQDGSVSMLYRRKAAAEAIGTLACIDAVDALIETVQNEKNIAVCAAAMGSLLKLQVKRSFTVLKKTLIRRADCAESAILAWVKECLSRYMPFPNWSLLFAITDDIKFCLRMRFCSIPTDAFIRERLLYQFSQTHPFADTLSRNRTLQSDLLICGLIHVLGAMREIKALSSMIARLENPVARKEQLLEILEALGKLGDERVVPSVRAFLCHDHPHIRHAARQSLRSLGI